VTHVRVALVALGVTSGCAQIFGLKPGVQVNPDGANPDAAPLMCSLGATQTNCAQHLWATCLDLVDQATAAQRCANWNARLAELSMSDYTCLRAMVAPTGDVWIGLVQASTSPIGAGNAGMGWTWNGSTMTPTFFNWGASEPDDDNAGNETHQADCAHVPDGVATWDDTPCSSIHGFVCDHAMDN
jgi:hypothetical protein